MTRRGPPLCYWLRKPCVQDDKMTRWQDGRTRGNSSSAVAAAFSPPDSQFLHTDLWHNVGITNREYSMEETFTSLGHSYRALMQSPNIRHRSRGIHAKHLAVNTHNSNPGGNDGGRWALYARPINIIIVDIVCYVLIDHPAWITLFRYSIVVDVSKFLPNESL